jgi:hypothetical protein
VHAAPTPDADVTGQRQIVDAFLVAARSGDFEALLSILAPDCVLRFDIADIMQGPVVGAPDVARRILATAPRFISLARPFLVNGAAGLIFDPGDRALAVLGFTVVSGRIEALDLIIGPVGRDVTSKPPSGHRGDEIGACYSGLTT